VVDVCVCSAKLKTAQTNLTATERDASFLTDTQIPSLIRDVASLQAVQVLRGDYDLKITRQDYFTGNQNQVLFNDVGISIVLPSMRVTLKGGLNPENNMS